MPVYVIGQIDITDPDEYGTYEQGFMEVFEQFGGQMLAVDDEADHLEGSPNCTRMVIARFPDRESAQRWYGSAAYQELAAVRWRASTGIISIVEGFG